MANIEGMGKYSVEKYNRNTSISYGLSDTNPQRRINSELNRFADI